MPVNDIQCSNCGIVERQHTISEMYKYGDKWCIDCTCGLPAEILCSLTMKNNDWFRPHWNRDIDYDPVYVESKQHLKELCLKNDVTNHALGDVRNITEI